MNFFFQNFALGLLNKVFVLLIIICDGFGSMGVEGRKSEVFFYVSLNHLQTKQIHPNNSNVETRKRLHQQRQDLTLKYGWYLHQFSACREEKKPSSKTKPS